MRILESVPAARNAAGALAKGLAVSAAVGLAVAATSTGAMAQWEPDRPIEFVIQTSPGGGSDTYARFWIGLIEQYGLSPVPITPVNMPGGAGAVALTYLSEQAGQPYFMTPTLNSVVITPLMQEIPVMFPSQDLTPLALMAIDPFLLWVNPAKFTSWEEFHAACQADRLTAAGTSARTEDEIQITLLAEAAGCQPFRYVPETGGGAVATGVAGQQYDFSVNQPSEAISHYPENMIPIVAFTPERLEAFPEAPTHWELGIGADNGYAELLDLQTGLHQMRGLIGPPDLPAEAVAWFENLWRQVFETPEWQDFMAQRAQVPEFKGAEAYREWLVTFENNHVDLINDVFGWEMRPDLAAR